jgi:hypothetical protein
MPKASPPRPATRVGVGHAGRIVSTLSNKSFPETVELWRRMCSVLADSSKSELHRDARQVIWGIEDEWGRRNKLVRDHDEYFNWPTTIASKGNGKLFVDAWDEIGMLKILGYQVGRHAGLPEVTRRLILSRVFSMRLPPVLTASKMDEWGFPTTSRRLQKMAESIASFTRNAVRRNDGSLDDAISEWEDDLGYLYNSFYIGKFHFAYPRTR